MTPNHRKSEYRLLFLIATQKLTQKAEEVFAEKKLPIQYHAYATGTAACDLADILGVGSVDKSVLIGVLPQTSANKMLIKLQNRLLLGTPNSGVAFTVPLSGCSGAVIHLMQGLEGNLNSSERNEGESMDGKYATIMAFVDQGFSEEVMAAARPAGATGGTVFHSRRIGNEEAAKLWGVSIQQEREIVLILAKKENKLEIMKAIGERCGVQSKAHGIVISLPVDNVAGLVKDIEE